MFLPSRNGPPLKLAIIRASSIGDVVLSTACLHLLSKLPQPVEVTWIGREPSLTLLKQAYPALTTIDLVEGYQVQDVVGQLANVHFMLDLQTNLRSRVIGRAFKKRYGRPVYLCPKAYLQRGRLVLEGRMYGRRRDLPAKALIPIRPQYKLMAETLREALSRHLPAESLQDLREFLEHPDLPVGESENESKPVWHKELQFGRWLAVAPGASYETKRAPMTVFADILKQLRVQYHKMAGEGATPLGLLFLGDKQDQKASLELTAELGWNDPILDLTGKLSLWEALLVLKDVNCLLSNDSGLAHIAEAVGTPVGVLFGPTVEAFGFAPWRAESRAFSVPLGCRPCSKHGKSPCRFGDNLCFHQIPSARVAEYLLNLLR